VFANTNAGVDITGASNIVVASNSIVDNGLAAGGPTPYGVLLDGTAPLSGVFISGNRIGNTGQPGYRQAYGIYSVSGAQGPPEKVMLGVNDLSANDTAEIGGSRFSGRDTPYYGPISVGIQGMSRNEKLRVYGGSSGGATAGASALAVVENSGDAMLQVLVPQGATSGVDLGDPRNFGLAGLRYNHKADTLSLRASGADRAIVGRGYIQILPTASAPDCNSVDHVGRIWFDNTTPTTVIRVCRSDEGRPGWAVIPTSTESPR
jgi:hypothetical protein